MIEHTKKIHSISCIACAAPLDVFGNQPRSKTLTCSFCGTVMDMRNHFKALYAFTHIQKVETPLRMGMKGLLQEVVFTVSGQLAYKSRDSHWMQFQLYSATHGYAQLIKQNTRYLFLRKTYYLPDKNLWMLKQGDTFTAQSIRFQIKHYHFAEIANAEGCLTFKVKPNQRNKQCFAKHDQYWYVSIQQRDHVDYFIGYEIELDELEKLFNAPD